MNTITEMFLSYEKYILFIFRLIYYKNRGFPKKKKKKKCKQFHGSFHQFPIPVNTLWESTPGGLHNISSAFLRW